MRTYVSTIGHHSTRVMRPILNNGIDTADTVVLLRPHDDPTEQSDDAVHDVRQTVQEIGPDTEVAVEQITYDAFKTAVLECVDVLEAADGTVVVNFDGGPREIVLPFTIATLARPDLVDTAFQFRDVDSKVCEVSLPNLVNRTSESTDETLQTLVALNGSATLPEIADEAEKARSTIGRHLDQLETAGAVRTDKTEKTRHVELTLGGRLRA